MLCKSSCVRQWPVSVGWVALLVQAALALPAGPGVSGTQLMRCMRVQHVILNHLYCQRNARGISATVVGATHRYRSKYVTTVLYKPQRRGGRATPLGGDNGGSTPPMSD